jgi:hypothetical protein
MHWTMRVPKGSKCNDANSSRLLAERLLQRLKRYCHEGEFCITLTKKSVGGSNDVCSWQIVLQNSQNAVGSISLVYADDEDRK